MQLTINIYFIRDSDNKAYIYKVNYDKSIQYLQTNDMNRYKKLTFDGVPQSPTEMNQNDFMEK